MNKIIGVVIVLLVGCASAPEDDWCCVTGGDGSIGELTWKYEDPEILFIKNSISRGIDPFAEPIEGNRMPVETDKSQNYFELDVKDLETNWFVINRPSEDNPVSTTIP